MDIQRLPAWDDFTMQKTGFIQMASENGGKKKPQSRGRIQTALKLDDSRYDFLSLGLRNFVSEMFGTGLLVFLGCMGCTSLGEKNHTGTALSFALAVFLSIQICCHNSGGHVNPALTIVSLFFKRLTIPMAAIYILGQCTGSILGFGLLKAVTPSDHVWNSTKDNETGLCTTVPNSELSIFQALLTEFILTTVLMLVVCSVWDSRNDHLHDSATLKFGFAIFSLAYAGVAYTGCSMNPARSLGPAVWNNVWTHHWIFWVGPILAGFFSGYIYTAFFCGPIKSKIPPKDTKPLEMETVSTVTS